MSDSIDIPLLLSVLERVLPALETDSDPRRAKRLAKALADQIEGVRDFGLAELADAIDEHSPETIHRFIAAAEAALIASSDTSSDISFRYRTRP